MDSGWVQAILIFIDIVLRNIRGGEAVKADGHRPNLKSWLRRYGVLAAMVVILVLTWLPRWIPAPAINTPEQWDETRQNFMSYKATLVAKKTFRNETVPLDGFHYTGCVFENVTFEYNGTSPIFLNNNRFVGSLMFASANPSSLAAMGMVLRLIQQRLEDSKQAPLPFTIQAQ